MIGMWKRELRQRGAIIEDERVRHFGDPSQERAALAANTTVHPLCNDALLGVQGEDAGSFLQSQLTVDVRLIDSHHARMAAYCSPKGRVIATVLVTHHAQQHFLHLPADLADSIRARLQKYVLRARVKLIDASCQWVLIGIGGPGADRLVAGIVGPLPNPSNQRFAQIEGGGVSAVELAKGLFALAIEPAHAAGVWDRLAAEARPAGPSGWEWRKVAAGLPTITVVTQEQFVPQMLGLDTLGAVSFDKGCYPGQEIVARSQYLGEVKRRMFAFHDPSASAKAGHSLCVTGMDAGVGSVVNAAAAPAGGSDLLAVVLAEHAEHSPLRLGNPHGPVLSYLGAPRAVDVASRVG